jgi:4'-phosphopantetheinyl transferase
LTLSEDEIAVRWMRTPPLDSPHIMRFLETLDGEERAQADRFKLGLDRAAYVAAHALLRMTLSAVTGAEPRLWRFASDAQGRPCLTPPNELRFSLSHCRRFVACAVRRGADIGIDIEDLSRPESQWGDALDFLPDCERKSLEGVDGSARRDRFFRLWTVREAFAKATGMGMAKAFEAVEFSIDPLTMREAGIGKGSFPGDWNFWADQTEGNFAWALAARSSPDARVTLREHVPT